MSNFWDDIRNKALKPCYLFYGEEPYLQTQAVIALRKHFAEHENDFNIDILDGENCTLLDAVQSVSTASFFCAQKLVIVRNAPWFSTKKNKNDDVCEEKKMDLPGQSELLKYLAKPLAECCLLFITAAAPDKRMILFKAVSKTGGVENFASLNKQELIAWVQKRFTESQKTAAQDLIDNLIAISGGSLYVLEHEIEKVVLFAAEKNVIRLADCCGVLSPSMELSVFDLIDAVSQKQRERALAFYEEMLARGEVSQKIAVLLIKQFHNLLAVCDMQRMGFQQSRIKAELGISYDFLVTKLCRYANCFTIGELMRIEDAFLAADYISKTGGRGMDDAIKDIILKICI